MYSYKTRIDFNNFLKNIQLKKQFMKSINLKREKLKMLKHKDIDKKKNINDFIIDNTVMYIIDITFLKTNTILNVMDFDGTLQHFYSAGNVGFKGKSKKTRLIVFKQFYKILVNELKFLRKVPVALHLKNVGSNKFWILKVLKRKFYIKVVRTFNVYPHNGCRKPKARRKKTRTKRWKRRNG